MTRLDPSRAPAFGDVAHEYARWRPTYVDAAVGWLTGDALTVVDLGTGIAKMTGRLLARGLSVHAVEHDPRMLAVLGQQFPTAHCHASKADQIPLP